MNSIPSAATILVVDDDPIQMRLICDTLQDCGYVTDGFTDPLVALESLKKVHYELMIIDLVMPVMNGIELMQAVHRCDPDIGCLILTGVASIATAIEALKLGAVDYVVKPFDLRVLQPALQRAAHLRQAKIDKTVATLALKASHESLAELNQQLRVAQKAADQANRAKTQFLAQLSHEIRTPLNSILGFAHILNSESMPTTAPQKKQFAKNILSSSRHLLNLADEILDLASVESGKLKLSMDRQQLKPIVDECAGVIAPLCAKDQITLMVDVPDALHIFADAKRLKQILINLLSNAVKYNHSTGTIHLTCYANANNLVTIDVADSGDGIPKSQLKRLFRPFERLGQEQGRIPGTGLGLVMVKRLTEQMGGQVTVTSEPSKGSTFSISLCSS